MCWIISLLLLAGVLGACSAAKLAYDRAPDLAYWYLDDYVDFTGAQSLQVKDELVKLQSWHRQTQLPGYRDSLRKLQQQLLDDISPAQACTLFADFRSKLLRATEQAAPAAASLAGTLTDSQLSQIERKFNRSNTDWKGDFMDGTPQSRRSKRYQQAVKRAEMLYENLDAKQLEVVRQSIDQSGFEPTRTYAERLRRQQDTLQSLRRLANSPSSGNDNSDQPSKQMRALFERSLDSPNPAYRSYQEKLTQDGCKTFANLHNSTSGAQRGQAIEKLRRYEQDMLALMALNDR